MFNFFSMITADNTEKVEVIAEHKAEHKAEVITINASGDSGIEATSSSSKGLYTRRPDTVIKILTPILR